MRGLSLVGSACSGRWGGRALCTWFAWDIDDVGWVRLNLGWALQCGANLPYGGEGHLIEIGYEVL